MYIVCLHAGLTKLPTQQNTAHHTTCMYTYMYMHMYVQVLCYLAHLCRVAVNIRLEEVDKQLTQIAEVLLRRDNLAFDWTLRTHANVLTGQSCILEYREKRVKLNYS